MSNELFNEFVSVVFDGNGARAARAIRLTRSAVSRISKGQRGVTPAVAERIETASAGRYPKERFIWPQQDAA